jgi:hypothetical protein
VTDRIIEVHSDGGGGSGALTALAVVSGLIVVLAALCPAGVFRHGRAKHEIDMNINKPGLVIR